MLFEVLVLSGETSNAFAVDTVCWEMLEDNESAGAMTCGFITSFSGLFVVTSWK